MGEFHKDNFRIDHSVSLNTFGTFKNVYKGFVNNDADSTPLALKFLNRRSLANPLIQAGLVYEYNASVELNSDINLGLYVPMPFSMIYDIHKKERRYIGYAVDWYEKDGMLSDRKIDQMIFNSLATNVLLYISKRQYRLDPEMLYPHNLMVSKDKKSLAFAECNFIGDDEDYMDYLEEIERILDNIDRNHVRKPWW